MGDKSEIIDVEYENSTKGGDVIDKGSDSGSTGGSESGSGTGISGKPEAGEGTSSQYGATINISYSWDPASSFNYSSLAMTLNGNAYLPKTSSTYIATFTYSTDLSNVTSYNINLFYKTGGKFETQHQINYVYDVNTGVGTMPGTNPTLND